jgi:hypothetical protein
MLDTLFASVNKHSWYLLERQYIMKNANLNKLAVQAFDINVRGATLMGEALAIADATRNVMDRVPAAERMDAVYHMAVAVNEARSLGLTLYAPEQKGQWVRAEGEAEQKQALAHALGGALANCKDYSRKDGTTVKGLAGLTGFRAKGGGRKATAFDAEATVERLARNHDVRQLRAIMKAIAARLAV